MKQLPDTAHLHNDRAVPAKAKYRVLRPVVVPAGGSPKVELKAIKDGEYVIGGVLTDVYQRKMTSEIANEVRSTALRMGF